MTVHPGLRPELRPDPAEHVIPWWGSPHARPAGENAITAPRPAHDRDSEPARSGDRTPPPLPSLAFLRHRWPDLLLGLAVAVLGLVEIVLVSSGSGFFGSGVYRTGTGTGAVLTVLLLATATGLFRARPGAALTLLWVTAFYQLAAGTPVLQVELAAGFVAYGAARHGSAAVAWLAGLSVPLGVLTALVVIQHNGVDQPYLLTRAIPYQAAIGLAPLPLVGTSLLTVVAVPWLLGLLGRVRDRAARDQAAAEHRRIRAEAARSQAQEIAALREGQAQLAHDVHDVVGHSLAVILVQAESAQFLGQDDTAALHRTMENIAASARQSLRDVREVLASTGGEGGVGTPATGSLDTLLDGLRAAGNTLDSTVEGTPHPLPPELETVAFRVLQEMLTNALKHGSLGEPVRVERCWKGQLRMEVRNVVGPGPRGPGVAERAGSGIDGMRRRLDAVGGRLDVRCTDEDGPGRVFTATAWMPLRAEGAQ